MPESAWSPRIGVVLSGDSGMLPLVARAVRMGVGGPLGDGNQLMSWISLNDLLGILLETIANESLEGPVNAVAPEPVSNRVFTKTLASVLQRPVIFRVPAPVLRLVAGELAGEVILVSQGAIPAKLAASGFTHAFGSLETTLRHELGRYTTKGTVHGVGDCRKPANNEYAVDPAT